MGLWEIKIEIKGRKKIKINMMIILVQRNQKNKNVEEEIKRMNKKYQIRKTIK